MKLTNMKRYYPDEMPLGNDIQYFIDDDGNDWFLSISKFTKNYALVIENDTGIIRGIATDVSRLYPVGLTVVEIDALPDGCDGNGGWIFSGDAITVNQEKAQTDAAERKKTLMTAASQQIDVLADAVEFEEATAEETAALEAWRRYRVALNRIDTTSAAIDWLESP